jgi:outer membrane protein TolC
VRAEWVLFEGGKRCAELKIADSRIRAAIAQADALTQTVAFQVTQAYTQAATARRSIELARPAVEQARESLRLTRERYRRGDATQTEVTEAEAALTKAEQDYLTSVYDYLTALARLEHAVGVSPTLATFPAAGHPGPAHP